MRSRRVAAAVVCLIGLLLIALVIRQAFAPGMSELASLAKRPSHIMGTECALTAVASGRDRDERMARALADAERALRQVEMRMSTYIKLTELSHLNAAPAGKVVKLSPPTMGVLRLARRLHRQTDGAFDVTCLPIFRLWGQAGKAGRLPTGAELAAAKAASGWEKFELLEGGARKKLGEAGVGLGGIAKGYAIDLAAKAMERTGCHGGLVNVGGDIRCFGVSPRGDKWRVAVNNPFAPGSGEFLGTLELTDRAVCTSGNYERFSTIGGKPYSHIVDPRTARPVDLAPSVTVLAPTAAIADGWATALSVLGEAGLKRIDPNSGIEALVVIGGPDDYRIAQTPGFAKLLAKPISPPATRKTQFGEAGARHSAKNAFRAGS